MARFLVTYRERTGLSQAYDQAFTADRVVLSTDTEWFHFYVGERIMARIRAYDVRAIEVEQAEIDRGENP